MLDWLLCSRSARPSYYPIFIVIPIQRYQEVLAYIDPSRIETSGQLELLVHTIGSELSGHRGWLRLRIVSQLQALHRHHQRSRRDAIELLALVVEMSRIHPVIIDRGIRVWRNCGACFFFICCYNNWLGFNAM